MLYAGSDDGVYRVTGVADGGPTSAERILDAGRVYRVRQFEAIDGIFVTAEAGLYHSPDGEEWTAISVSEESVYAVGASPSGDRLYAGTRPAGVFYADASDGLPTEAGDWQESDGFRDLRERSDWGLPRHDGLAQVRSLCTHVDSTDRVVAGVEVGGVYVSEDRGRTWRSRRIDAPEAEHSDDVHHLAMADSETIVAATGTGLYRTTDVGQTWTRLDADHPQRYFREAFVHDGRIHAGASPGLGSPSWDEETDHGLFESRDGRPLERVESPAPTEVPLGWGLVDGNVVVATHRGTLLCRGADGYEEIGSVPTPGDVRGRYLQLTWQEPS